MDMDLRINRMVDRWIKKWENGCLSCEDVKKSWEVWIPSIGDDLDEPTNPLEMVFQSNKFYENLITAFEKFIFYGYSKDCIEEMCKRGESTTCDKTSTLNSTEFYFMCIECEETTAYRTLCGECFENSEHRRHKYEMLTSSSEYCCCGESGTWEKPWYCSKHKSETEFSLPENVKNRASIVIEIIVQYIDHLLNTFQNTDDDCIDGLGRDNVFCVTVYSSYDICYEEYHHILKNSLLKTSKNNYFEYLRCLVLEGKITIKLPTRTECETLKTECTAENFQLKAMVFHICDVVFQKFISSMVIYLRKLVGSFKELRRIFSKFMLTPVGPLNRSVAEQILKCSTSLPRRMLTTLNELLLFGVIKEYETKEEFAKMVTGGYKSIMTTIGRNKFFYLSEIIHQLFSIPQLAHRLIANENILSVILTAFLNDGEISDKRNHFEKDIFGRMDYIWSRSIRHLKVVDNLLTAVPTVWTKELRVGFLNGFACFLRVLNTLQGIDLEVRETKDHVEDTENRFESAVISTELASCVSSFLKWCGSDNEVFNIAFAETQMMVNQRVSLESDLRSEKTVELLTYSTECLPYDSAIHPVSVYLPLFRFFVGLFGISVRNSGEMLSLNALKTIAVSKMFDPVLKIQTRLAQNAAGMWKRNGDSRLIRWLTCGRNRAEILDRDIQLLQMVASVTESNEFLIQILEKYGLIDWLRPSYEKTSNNFEESAIISAKFLHLLITVLVERNFPEISDVTEEDRLKHQIIHLLCIEPFSRLDVKLLVNFPTEADMTRLMEEVAVLKKPSSISENVTYELRESLCDRFNPLYYYYSLEKMSEANEFQRHRRKAAGEPDCFPPPELPTLKEFYVPMVNIFQCDVMLHIMCTVLNRFVDLESKSSSETHLEYVLYLIGYALQEEQSNRYPMLSFTKQAAKWNLLECLEKIATSNREDLPKDLLKWTVRKYEEVAHVTTKAITTNVPEETGRVKKSQYALAKRAKVMEEILKMQKNFMDTKERSEEECESDEDFDSDTEALGDTTEQACILCHETQKLGLKGEVLVMPGYFQHSTVLCLQRENKASDAGSPVLTSNIGPAIYTSSCGHVMHSKCLQPHLEKKHQSHEEEDDDDYCDCSKGFDAEKGEFLCPFCESLSNTVLPLLPASIFLDDGLKQAVLKFTANFQSATRESALNVWKSLSYTVHVIETILRDSKKPILGNLSSSHHACLQYFTNVATVATQLYPNDDFYISYIENLRLLLSGETTDLTTHLRLDMFGLLVTILFSETDRNETVRFHTIRLVFVAQIVKILIETDFDGMVDDVKDKTVTPFGNILRMLGKDLSHLSERFIWTFVRQACVPFLRRCVLFFSFLTDDPVPVELTESGGDTFASMCTYLKFPQTPEELFDKTYVQPHVQKWFEHPDLKNSSTFKATDPHHINQLIELPQEYFEICRMAASFKCPNSDDGIEGDLHLCLVCGEMICTKVCCYEMIDGEYEESLQVHSEKCKSELYLNVNDTDIVFRSSSMSQVSAFVPGPYSDEYHETDCIVDNRANPLFLSAEKYKLLHTLWLNHGIFEKISRLFRSAEE